MTDRWWLTFLMVLALCLVCYGAEYRYPADLSVKSLKLEVSESAEHTDRLRSRKVPLESVPYEAVMLHLRLSDGSDMTVVPNSISSSTRWKKQKGNSWTTEAVSKELLWKPSISGAQVGEVYPCYISFEAGDKKWATHEFTLQIGGTGKHMQCEKCFKLGPAPTSDRMATTESKMKGHVRGGVPQKKLGSSALLDGQAIVGHHVVLHDDILVYALDALPDEKPMGRLKTGMTVYVSKIETPSLVQIQFTTSTGRDYAGAAAISDLVPQQNVSFGVETTSVAPHEHQNHWTISNISFHLVGSGTAFTTVELCCVRDDGKKQTMRPSGTSTSSSEYTRMGGTLSLSGSRAGDEYLCYILHNNGKDTWVSQPIGLRCGTGKNHNACPECFSLMSQTETMNLLNQLVMNKKMGSLAGRGEVEGSANSGYRLGKVILTKDVPIYSLKALPQELPMGTAQARAGEAIYIMEDLDQKFVRVRFFMTRGDRSREGAVKKSDLDSPAQ